MSLNIILDKSAFQALNHDEIVMLHNYYHLNVTPILVMEILGDLKKDIETGEISKEKVVGLAKKLLPYNSVVSIFFKNLIGMDLIGKSVYSEFRPIPGNAEIVKSSTGSMGFKTQESDEEIAIRRWKEGEFTELEKLLSEQWRKSTTQKDLLQNLKDSLKQQDTGEQRIKNTEELTKYVDELLNSEQNQTNLLMFIISEFAIDNSIASEAFLRWEQSDKKSIASFAPYAFYCCRVKMLFYFILKHDLFGGVKPTNLLDLEYLYYLPFCKVFSSNDKFHKNFVPLIIDKEQSFVVGQDLKNDFRNIADYRSTLSERTDIDRTLKEPPHLHSSLTFQLWAKYFDFPQKFKSKITAEKLQEIKEKMDEISAAEPLEGASKLDDPDFWIQKSSISITDLCPCGSGKQFKDCHLPSDYFINRAKYE